MFQNVNKYWTAQLERLFGKVIWRGHLERSFGEYAIASLTQTPDGPLFDPPKDPAPADPRWILKRPQLL